jgi:L-rhamnose mutarotase
LPCQKFSIYLRKLEDDRYFLFSYFEYMGEDFSADMAIMADDPGTQEWWKQSIPCQQPLIDRAAGKWWASMEEVFHLD